MLSLQLQLCLKTPNYKTAIYRIPNLPGTSEYKFSPWQLRLQNAHFYKMSQRTVYCWTDKQSNFYHRRITTSSSIYVQAENWLERQNGKLR